MRQHLKFLGAALVVVASAGVVLVGAGPAYAEAPSSAYVDSGGLVVQAGAGAINTIYLTDSPEGFRINDVSTRIRLVAGSEGGCVTISERVVACPSNLRFVNFELGDRDDYLQNDSARRITVRGDAGQDKVLGGRDDDWMNGGAGADWLEGRGGDDDLLGGDDDDRMWGGDGDDLMIGELGADDVHGESGDDRLVNHDYRDRMQGSFGNDFIDASTFVDGGWGDDTILVGQDTTGDLHGGDGYDTLDYQPWSAGIRVSLDGNRNDGGPLADCGNPVVCPTVPKHNAHTDFEKVVGSDHADKMTGNDGPDLILGGAGNDQIFGKGGQDLLDAEGGTAQTVDGGAGGPDICRGQGTITRVNCEAT